MKKLCYLLLFSVASFFAAAQASKWKAEKGIFISSPAHDDMWRTHRIATGANWRIAFQYNEKISLGVRLTYDYFWERKHFPAQYKLPEESKYAFTVASLRAGIEFRKNKKWFYGAETGSGILHSCGATRIGLGWVEEFDGWTKYAVVSSLYTGRKLYRHNKSFGNIALVWIHIFAETHAENSAGIRINFNQKLR